MKNTSNFRFELKYMLYALGVSVIIIALFFDLKFLGIVLPISLIIIALLYLNTIKEGKKNKPNLFFLLTILSLIICDYLIYANFKQNFIYICVSVFFYTVFSALSLRKYLVSIDIKWWKIIAIPVLITSLLIFYLVFSISSLILEIIPDTKLIISLPVAGLLFYAIVSYYIYISDEYTYAVKIGIAAIICISEVLFISVNELLIHSRISTLFIALFHLIGIYFFMRFLVLETPKRAEEKIINKF